MSSLTQMLPLEAPPAYGNLGPLTPLNLADLEIQDNDLQSERSSLNQPEAIEIVQPSPEMMTMLCRTARFIAKKGSGFERIIMATNADNARFNFLKSSHPCHAFYQQKVTEYLAQPTNSDIQPDEGEDDALPDLQVQVQVPRKPLWLHEFTFPLPEGMTPKELNTVRLTAYFAALYGKFLLVDLVKSVIMYPQFGFLKPTDDRFNYFSQLVDAYSVTLMHPTCLKPRESVLDTARPLEDFFDRLQRDVQAPPLPGM